MPPLLEYPSPVTLEEPKKEKKLFKVVAHIPPSEMTRCELEIYKETDEKHWDKMNFHPTRPIFSHPASAKLLVDFRVKINFATLN